MKENDIKRKLVTISKEFGFRMPEVQLLLCQERFLARLSSMPEGQGFIWKGGSLILRLYRIDSLPRYTVDIDLMISGISTDKVSSIFQKAIKVDLNDGFSFINVSAKPFEREMPYGGERFEIDWKFFSKSGSRKLAIDACAGDIVTPQVVSSLEAFLLPMERENLEFKVYPKEFIFAEKLETAMRFRTGNTRCKDFIDMWMLIKSKMNKQKASIAIELCFNNRKTIFSIEAFRTVVSDGFFQKRLDKFRVRNYKDLSVPHINIIMRDILLFLDEL